MLELKLKGTRLILFAKQNVYFFIKYFDYLLFFLIISISGLMFTVNCFVRILLLLLLVVCLGIYIVLFLTFLII